MQKRKADLFLEKGKWQVDVITQGWSSEQCYGAELTLLPVFKLFVLP